MMYKFPTACFNSSQMKSGSRALFSSVLCSANVCIMLQEYSGFATGPNEAKIQILYYHVDNTHFHIVEMGCQMVQPLSADIVGPKMSVNLTPAFGNASCARQICSTLARP